MDAVEGIVVERLSGGVIVGLLGDLLRAFVPAGRERRLDVGDRVSVRIERVSARRNELAVSVTGKVGAI